MNDKKYYVGSIGVIVKVDTNVDISEAVTLNLLVKKPSGKEVVWTGELGSFNKIGVYTTINYTVKLGDWDEAGWWSLQVFVETTDWKLPGATVKFRLYPAYQ